MGSPVGERGQGFKWFHHSSSAYTGGLTKSIDFNLIPGDLSAHTGLSRIQAITTRPFAAAVGFIAWEPVNGDPVMLNALDSSTWAPQVYAKMGSFTLGCHVARGDMTCWLFFQMWG